MTYLPHRFLSIVVPVLNEEKYIESCLSSLVTQLEDGDFEILVMDGGSSDATTEIVTKIASRNSSIRLISNPKRTQAAALNLAARIAAPQAMVLARADAHAIYPRGFMSACLDALQETAAQSVVTTMHAVGKSGFQRAVAAAQNSRLGNGGAAHRLSQDSASRYVDHGHHALFDRQFFLDCGGYDEHFSHNEDAEYDYRVHLAGGRVWLCADIPVVYFPRASLAKLMKQYFRHGAGRAEMLAKHSLWPKPRQLAPVFFLLGGAGGLMLVPLYPWLGAAPSSAYLLACLGWGAAEAVKKRDPWLLGMGTAAITMHMSWGAGFLVSICRAWGRRTIRLQVQPWRRRRVPVWRWSRRSSGPGRPRGSEGRGM